MLASVVIGHLTSGADMGFFGDIIGGIGSVFGAVQSHKDAKANRAMQDDAMKHGIAYKVKDARESGINPYYALGASTVMPTGSISDTSGYGNAGASFGQGIDRAVAAGRTHDERSSDFVKKQQQLQLTNMELQNNILRSDLAKRSGQLGPALPDVNQRWLLDGQGEVPRITVPVGDKMKRVQPNPLNPGQEGFAVPDVGFSRDVHGNYVPVPSEDVMKRQSNDILGMLNWNLRNRILPMFGSEKQPDIKIGGQVYVFNPLLWRYEPASINGSPIRR